MRPLPWLIGLEVVMHFFPKDFEGCPLVRLLLILQVSFIRVEIMMHFSWSGSCGWPVACHCATILACSSAATPSAVIASPSRSRRSSSAPLMPRVCTAIVGAPGRAAHWALLPPSIAAYSKLPPRQWFADVLPGLAKGAIGAGGAEVVQCVQRAGEALFVPAGWGHAVLNMKPSIGFAAEFERRDAPLQDVEDGGGAHHVQWCNSRRWGNNLRRCKQGG